MIRVLNFLKYFVPFSVVLFVSQYFITQSLATEHVFFHSVWSIYAFNIIATFLVYLLLIFVYKVFKDFTGFAFLGRNLFRMMAAVVFLIWFIQSDVEAPIIDLGAFFIPYFLFLFFEVYFTIQLLNKR